MEARKEARKKVTRLFPVESPFGAICAEIDEESRKIIFSAANTTKYVAKNPKLSNEDSGVLLEAEGLQAMVLPNGYCFYRKDGQVMLANLLIRSKKSNISTIDVDVVINPGMIALLDHNDEDLTVCGVSNNGKRLLAYTISEPRNEDKGIRRFATTPSADGLIGVLVHELDKDDDRTITNIASCRYHNADSEPTSRHVVLGFSNGEIEVFIARGAKKLKREMKLKSSNADFVNMDLLLTESGQLVACSRMAKKIEVWDLAKADVSQTHAIAEVGDLCLSLDGSYLVARDNSKEHEQAVQVYEMPRGDSTKLQHSRLLTKNNIECVAVGPEGSLLTAHNNVDGKLTMQNEGNLLSLLQGKVVPVNLQPTPERVSEAHRPKKGINTKDLFGKFVTLKKKPTPHKPLAAEAVKAPEKKPQAEQPAAKPAEVPVVNAAAAPVEAANNNNNAPVEPAKPVAPAPVVVAEAAKPVEPVSPQSATAEKAVVADDKAVEKLDALKEPQEVDHSKKAKLSNAGSTGRKFHWPTWGKSKGHAAPAPAEPAEPPVANDNNAKAKDGEIREMKLH